MLASLIFSVHYRRFTRACETPLVAQSSRLRAILRQGAATALGRACRFDQLTRVGDPASLIRQYQDRLPIRSYREMQPELDAVYQGDWQRLCPSRPVFFAMTAGSTGRYKYIPVTREYRWELGRGSLIYYGALEAACPSLRELKCQFLVGSAEGGSSPAGTPQGFASGFNYRNLPAVVRRRFVLPYWVFTIEDAAERCYAMARLLVEERRLGALCAISPVNLINLRAALEREPERLLADLSDGTLTVRSRSGVAGSYRGRPNPDLARTLERARARDGRFPEGDLFPSLQLLVCWKGGNMGYYLDELERHYNQDRLFEFPVSATEGIFAIPCPGIDVGGALAVSSHFLEFLPEGGAAELPALRADQLTVGGTYRLVTTNAGGLYRYDMEDIVRVTGWFRRTPVVEFVSKKDRQVSVSNERLTELDVTVAMQAASRRRGFHPPEFLFVPCSDRRYRVLIDGASLAPRSPAVRDIELGAFATELERQLRLAATGYDFERDDDLLHPLELVVTEPGALRKYLAGDQAGGSLPNAQLKPMHLTNRFDSHRLVTGGTIHAA